MNGDRKNDVWSSEDGVNWTEETNSAPFVGRSLHACTKIDDKIWVIGGANGSDWRNDIWYTENGSEWTEISDGVSFIGRHSHTATAFDDKIFMVGGIGSDFELKNEVLIFN